MIKKALQGRRNEMKPDTFTFNIVINALARGIERGSEIRAEALLAKMENMDCDPDATTFNSILNKWASSRLPGSAQRATAILNQMIKRYDEGHSSVGPDAVTFGTVLKALGRSRDRGAIHEAEAIFDQYEQACAEGKWNISYNTATFNSMLNCYAKSQLPDADEKALLLLEKMKSNLGKPGWDRCVADVCTYCSVIGAIGRQGKYEGSQLAISLLGEVEKLYEDTGARFYQPNFALFTSVINAIGKSGKEPDRAQTIVDKVESAYLQRSSSSGMDQMSILITDF